MERNSNFSVYDDIRKRAGGEIYLGVVGPVRTGKSTFIKRFMESSVLPLLTDEVVRQETRDELPQAAQGKTIMTTEPKFVPAKAAEIPLDEQTTCKIRLIDCVGFMIEGAEGHLEEGKERMVRTPWFDTEVPFSEAARIGTEKVIHEHATLGVVVTTDGSFTGIMREAYEPAEEETVRQLKKIGKPFVMILNTSHPYSEDTRSLSDELRKKYDVTVLPMNVEHLTEVNAKELLEQLLYEFPVTRWYFETPEWTRTLTEDSEVMTSLFDTAKAVLRDYRSMRQLRTVASLPGLGLVDQVEKRKADPANGEVTLNLSLPKECYFNHISELAGEEIESEAQLLALLQKLSAEKRRVQKLSDAYTNVTQKGYGVMTPQLSEITLEKPELIKHGNKYGIRMKAYSPSIHLIKANIETEIAPIVGSKEQAEGLLSYMRKEGAKKEDFLNVNIFGKSVGELVEDGMRTKIAMMDEESQMKLQESMEKIVNDLNGGMVCIII